MTPPAGYALLGLLLSLAFFFGSVWGSSEESFSNGYTGPAWSRILPFVTGFACLMYLLCS